MNKKKIAVFLYHSTYYMLLYTVIGIYLFKANPSLKLLFVGFSGGALFEYFFVKRKVDI